VALLTQVKPGDLTRRIWLVLWCPPCTRADLRPVENAFGRTTSQVSPAPVEISALTLTTEEISKTIRMAGNVNCMLDERYEGIDKGEEGMLEKPTLLSV